MGDRRKSQGSTCAVCREKIRKGSWVEDYAGFDRHPRCAPVSDPAPTVEAGTTEEGSVDDKGPWFGAMYDGRCSVNECQIFEGDRIRADGQGGYECEDCVPEAVGEGPIRLGGDWQAQASAAARRHVDAQTFTGGAAADGEVAAAFLAEANEGLRPEYRVSADEFMDPAATEDVKPVMSVSGQPKKVRRDHMKRYAVVLPGETELETYKSSGEPVGRTRATTFNKAATDKKNINDWGKRNVVIGASRRRDLLLKAQGLTHENDRDRLNAIVVELEETAGSKVGSDLGTYLHDFTEYMDAGLKTWRDAPEEFQRSLALYAQALADAGLEPIRSLIERTTIIREFGWVCGTFDRIFYHRPSGRYVIGDLKTGKTMDYGKNEVECQLWTYAHGVNQNGIYDWNTDTWGWAADLDRYDPAEWGGAQLRVSESIGVVIHMPVQGPKEGTVELLWADLESGAAHAELCHAVRSQPKGKMKAWGDGPAPLTSAREPLHDIGGGLVVRHAVTPLPEARAAAEAIDWSKIDPTPWEVLFSQVRTSEDASELWRRAKAASVDRMELQRLVGLAQTALRQIGVKG